MKEGCTTHGCQQRSRLKTLGIWVGLILALAGRGWAADGDVEIQLGKDDGSSALTVVNTAAVERLRMTDDGRMGIGDSLPVFRLSLDNDGGILARGLAGAGADLVVTGAGTRLIWYPKKAAFRAGKVEADQWDDANIGSNSIAMGRNSQASAIFSTAIGPGTTASGNNSLALGRGTIASGNYSTAMGFDANASGGGAMALGSKTEASGNYSTSMGYQTTASGFYATATGRESTASGATSVAMGHQTTASGRRSIVGGEGTKAENYCSLVIGRYNALDADPHAASIDPADALFVVGNGTDDANRANAMAVFGNGDVLVAGDLTANGTTYPSDARWKTDIAPLMLILDKVTRLQGVNYYWNRVDYPEKNFSNERQIGLIAQEVESEFPELVKTDGEGFKSVAYAKLSAVLVEAVKELREQNQALKTQNQALERRLVRLESLVTGR